MLYSQKICVTVSSSNLQKGHSDELDFSKRKTLLFKETTLFYTNMSAYNCLKLLYMEGDKSF